MPLDRSAQKLRPRHSHLSHDLERHRRRLRSVSRTRQRARRVGEQTAGGAQAGSRNWSGRSRHGPRRARHLRAVSLAPRGARRGGAGRHTVPRRARTGAAARGLLLRRRPDPRRGLRVRVVCTEQDARGRRPLQRLPRTPRAAPAHRRQRRLHAVPQPGRQRALPHPALEALRRPVASSPRAGVRGGAVRGVPHAVAHLHGAGRSPRSQSAHPASRSVGGTRRAQRLQRLSQRANTSMGRRRDRNVVRRGPRSSLDRRHHRRARRPAGGGRIAGASRRRGRRSGDRPRHRGEPARSPRAERTDRRAAGARRFRCAGAHRRGAQSRGSAPAGAPHRSAAAFRPGARGAHRSGAPARRAAARRARRSAGERARRSPRRVPRRAERQPRHRRGAPQPRAPADRSRRRRRGPPEL